MHRYVTIAGAMIAVAALSFAAIACGDDDDDDDGGDGDATPAATQPAATEAPSETQPAATEPAATEPAGAPTEPASGGTTVNIIAADFSFTPASVAAPSGEEVTFVVENAGALPHTLTVYADQAYTTGIEGADTGQVTANGTGEFAVTFEEAGTFFFRCEVHPTQMEGTITVD